MADTVPVPCVYFAISNIPPEFRSADLRNYFSQYIESRAFHCFHYRHRPEVLKESVEPEKPPCEGGSSKPPVTEEEVTKPGSASPKRAVKSCCCIVSVHAREADRFVRMYAGNHWIDSKGNWLKKRCVIRRVKVSQDKGW